MKVSFNLEEKPLVSRVIYDQQKLHTYLRDRLMPRLQKYFALKVKNNEITNNEAKDYIVSILNKALESSFSVRELEKIEPYYNKFSFLPYLISQGKSGGHTTNTDDLIHQDAFILIALCVGYKKIIQQVTGVPVMNLAQCDYIGWDESKIFCADIKGLSKLYIQNFLSELLINSRIMTSQELAVSATATDEEDNCSDDFVEDETSAGTKSSADKVNNQDITQRSISFQESKEENSKDRTTSNEPKTKVDDANFLLNLALRKFLSWINELPEWLQKQILSSLAVRAVIESIDQNTKIYDKKVYLDIYQQDKSSSEADSFSYIYDAADQKVYVSETSLSELVNTNMLFDGNYVNGLILPTSIEQAINFNGLNFDDLALFM